jgi:uncharacterized protein (DUF1499 family)
MSKAQAGWIWLGAGLATAYFGWTNRRLFTVNDITTGESASYPALRSRVYYAEINRAMTAAEQAVKRLPGWELLSRDSDNDILEAAAAFPLRLFTDDITVYFFALGHGQTRVTLRARTRVGFGDLGRSAAHIRQLQAAMDDRLSTDAAF